MTSGFGVDPFATSPFGGSPTTGGFGAGPFGATPFGSSEPAAPVEPEAPVTPVEPETETIGNVKFPVNKIHRVPTPEWVIHPRQADLSRLYDPLSKWSKLVLIERHNTPDTWTITGPPDALSMFTRGSGSILDRNGEQVTTGSVISIKRGATRTGNHLVETMSVTFAEDFKRIGGRVVFPTPSHDLTATVSNFPAAYDLRTGPIETLIIDYIKYHAGSLAQTDRQVSRLRLPTSLGRGGTTQVSGRLDHLGVLVSSLAEAGNLKVKLKHTEDPDGSAWLDLVITTITDRSNDIRFGTADSMAAGIIEEWDYEIRAPETTRAVVAGGGELAARDFLQLDETVAETEWGLVVETLIDQRQVDPLSDNKQAELSRAAQDALDEGAGTVSVSFTPVFGPDLEYRRDVQVGDIVGYDLPGLDPAEDKIREATTTVTNQSGQVTEHVSVVVGTPDAVSSRTQQQQQRALRAINVLQRSK